MSVIKRNGCPQSAEFGRGKETKKVEFGAKVNMIQIDGINFIEHLDFNPFNEVTWFVNSIRCGRELFGKITRISANEIYATNKNMEYSIKCYNYRLYKKGRAEKYEEQRKIISSELNRGRATRIEGRFGTQKEHYGLQKIKAGNKNNEILWIFFSVHTSNAVTIAKGEILKQKENKVA